MNLYAPNIALFVVAGCLAMIGVLSSLPIELPIPGLGAANAAWYIFLGWFLRAACCRNARRSDNSPSTLRAARPKLLGSANPPCGGPAPGLVSPGSESCTPSLFLR